MRLFSLALVGALLTPAVSPSSAQPSTAEWQKTLIGVPSLQLPASGPKFHRLPLRDGKALTFLLAITTKNVLAALDPVGGSVGTISPSSFSNLERGADKRSSVEAGARPSRSPPDIPTQSRR